ncbi:HlyD family secretion protein [Pedobacter jeongneungensis]|uniref:HlyD family secretion protein n=1 Tax=Pedobacter jeongneungensis TaxID=947309 RepID=UPI00046A82C5|nr:HlyD family efflux transporter periplasmic adaptor subunit [Pedobacter jeongneungensis]
MKPDNLDFQNHRTEEVQNIIERMPTRFSFIVSLIIGLIFFLLITFGYLIRYPDVVKGQINVSSQSAPLKLVANISGKLKLGKLKSMASVKAGDLIAYIDNSADAKTVLHIDSLMGNFNPNDENLSHFKKTLPINLSLGELNARYYEFTNSLQELLNYQEDRLLEKGENNYQMLLTEQKKAITSALEKVSLSSSSMEFIHKSYNRDSILFHKKVISESEFDKSKLNYLSSRDGYQNALNSMINAKQAYQQTLGKLQEIKIQKPEKQKALMISLISSYNNLDDGIKSWIEKYTFRAPFDGKLQFQKFYADNQFIQSGDPIITIVPENQSFIGQVIVPSLGSGKIKKGQEVIVKLDAFPYMEYGSITGRVTAIAFASSSIHIDKTETESYMILVNFPNQMKTNYGSQLNFKAETKGTAEIVTNNRRLIERLFDNLRYALRK